MSGDIKIRGDLLDLWPERPWEFGEALAHGARQVIATTSPLRDDATFVEGVMQLILDRARKQGVVFKPEIDIMVIDDGARVAVGEIRPWAERMRPEPCCVGENYCDLHSSPLADLEPRDTSK